MMHDDNTEKPLDFLIHACELAAGRPGIVYQFIANAVAAAELYVAGSTALWLLAQAHVAKVAGFILGLASIGAAGLILAAGSVAVNRALLNPPRPRHEIDEAFVFIRNNLAALVQSYVAFFAFFVLAACVLLIPTTAARLGALGQLIYAPLAIPMLIMAAGAVLAIVTGMAVVPADIAAHERNFTSTFRAAFAYAVRQPRHYAWSLYRAAIASALVALPLALLAWLAANLLNELAGPVGGVEFYAIPHRLWEMSWAMVIGVIAALPMACFNTIVGLDYRRLAVPPAEQRPPRREPDEDDVE